MAGLPAPCPGVTLSGSSPLSKSQEVLDFQYSNVISPKDYTISFFKTEELLFWFWSSLLYAQANASLNFFHSFTAGSFLFWMPLYFLDNLISVHLYLYSTLPNSHTFHLGLLNSLQKFHWKHLKAQLSFFKGVKKSRSNY